MGRWVCGRVILERLRVWGGFGHWQTDQAGRGYLGHIEGRSEFGDEAARWAALFQQWADFALICGQD